VLRKSKLKRQGDSSIEVDDKDNRCKTKEHGGYSQLDDSSAEAGAGPAHKDEQFEIRI